MTAIRSWLLLTALGCLLLTGCGDSSSGKIPTDPATPANTAKAKDMSFGGSK